MNQVKIIFLILMEHCWRWENRDNTEYEEGVMFIKTKWYKNMYRNRAFVCYHTNV